MKTETFFCPHCYAIRKFTVSESSGTAMCEKSCTFRTQDLIKMKVKEE
jgi:hypothetical protein